MCIFVAGITIIYYNENKECPCGLAAIAGGRADNESAEDEGQPG